MKEFEHIWGEGLCTVSPKLNKFEHGRGGVGGELGHGLGPSRAGGGMGCRAGGGPCMRPYMMAKDDITYHTTHPSLHFVPPDHQVSRWFPLVPLPVPPRLPPLSLQGIQRQEKTKLSI